MIARGNQNCFAYMHRSARSLFPSISMHKSTALVITVGKTLFAHFSPGFNCSFFSLSVGRSADSALGSAAHDERVIICSARGRHTKHASHLAVSIGELHFPIIRLSFGRWNFNRLRLPVSESLRSLSPTQNIISSSLSASLVARSINC